MLRSPDATFTKPVDETRPRLKYAPAIFTFVLFALMIDIGGQFGLKYAAFTLLAVYTIFAFLGPHRIRLPRSLLIFEWSLFTVAPLVLLAAAVIVFQVDVGDAFSQIFPLATWLMLPLLLRLNSRKQMLDIFGSVMFVGAVIVLATYVLLFMLYFAGRSADITAITRFAQEYNMGQIGARPLTSVSGISQNIFFPNVYYRWTLLLIPAAILYVRGRTSKLVVAIAAVIVTLSVGTILATIGGIIWASLMSLPTRDARTRYVARLMIVAILIGVAVAVLYATGYHTIVDFLLDKFATTSPSTTIKLNHVQSILSVITSDPWTMLFGTGVGSPFHSQYLGQSVIVVEVSYFNFVRQFGLIYALLFVVYVLVVMLTLGTTDADGRLLGIGLGMSFLAAGTNPLLISPMFFTILVVARAYRMLYDQETAHPGEPLDERPGTSLDV